jgi:transcriptional regulator with XRE-family HTH domain
MDTKPEYPNLNKVVASLLKQRGSSLSKTSVKLGKAKNYLTVKLRSKNPNIGLLIDLSNLIGVNLLEAYRSFLAPDVRHSVHERDLMMQLSKQAEEILKLTEERDRYWKVIENKVK